MQDAALPGGACCSPPSLLLLHPQAVSPPGLFAVKSWERPRRAEDCISAPLKIGAAAVDAEVELGGAAEV